MARKSTKKTSAENSEFQKLAAAEKDTVRAAHFRRAARGADDVRHLTIKDDTKRRKRDALIKALPAIVPIIETSAGPNEPTINDLAALQAENAALKQQLAEQAA